MHKADVGVLVHETDLCGAVGEEKFRQACLGAR